MPAGVGHSRYPRRSVAFMQLGRQSLQPLTGIVPARPADAGLHGCRRIGPVHGLGTIEARPARRKTKVRLGAIVAKNGAPNRVKATFGKQGMVSYAAAPAGGSGSANGARGVEVVAWGNASLR